MEKLKVVAIKFLEAEHPGGNRKRKDVYIGKAHYVRMEILANAVLMHGHRKITEMPLDSFNKGFLYVCDRISGHPDRSLADIGGHFPVILESAAMNQSHLESLHAQVEGSAQAHFRTSQNQYPISNLRRTLAERPHDTGTNEGLPQKIAHSFYKYLFGQIRGTQVIPDVDCLEPAAVKAMPFKKKHAGAVSLIIAGNALKLKGTAYAGSQNDSAQPVLPHSSSNPVGALRMAGGKNQLTVHDAGHPCCHIPDALKCCGGC
jgi:hypothetical protein